LGIRFIVGGDFNASRLLDRTLGERGSNEFLDRIRDEGFVSLHRRFHEADEQTYFKKGKGLHQLDYLYADAQPASLCRACSVHAASGFSDHAPLLADFSAG
jgi:endonuclease/exonuclease/phosphatase (EEP) superfamily protein YafD